MNRAVKRILSFGTLVSVSLAAAPARAGHWESSLYLSPTAVVTQNPLTTGGFASVAGLDASNGGLTVGAINTIAGAYAGNPTGVPVGGQGADVGYSGVTFTYQWVRDNPTDYAPAHGIRIGKSWVAVAGAGLAPGGSASATASGLPAATYFTESTPRGDTSVSADPANAPVDAWNYLWGIPPATPPSYVPYALSVAQLITGGRIGYSLGNTAIDVAHEMEWIELWYQQERTERDGMVFWAPPLYTQNISLPTVSLRTGTAVDGFNDATFSHQYIIQGFQLP